MNRYGVSFGHTSGGDSLLPPEDRGYFDGWTVDVDAPTVRDAEAVGMQLMYDHARDEHPDWVLRAIDDLEPTAKRITTP